MFKPKRNILSFFCLLVYMTCVSSLSRADEIGFNRLETAFKNFISCELTRPDAIDYFKGKPFTITMIDIFDIQTESDMKIITGAIKCFVADRHQTLYTAVGVNTIMGKNQVGYFTIRNTDFSILATELFRFPYKERCKWSAYNLDFD